MNASIYYDREAVARRAAEGHHREIVGGLWDEIGQLQCEFLVAQGLQPHHHLLDVGCGSLRGGVHFIRYLDRNRYFGIDMNEALLDAGYDVELARSGLSGRLDRGNLRTVHDFDVSGFGICFDYAIALSVFTHLPLNTIRICLERLAPAMLPGGKFFATFFEAPAGQETWKPIVHSPGNIRTSGDKDPYHYRVEDLYFAAAGLPWQPHHIGDFGHPRSQKMMAFRRL